MRAPSAPARATTAAPSPAPAPAPSPAPTPARARATPGQKSVEPTTEPKPHFPSTPRVEKPAAGAAGLEAALGADWSVWIGGVALALGALLLVRYSIEQGWFGPAARCVLGLALGAALIAAGEWLEPHIVGPTLGTTPIFNWLLLGYGAPALAFAAAARLLRRPGKADAPTSIAEALATLFAALLVYFEIRHASTAAIFLPAGRAS